MFEITELHYFKKRTYSIPNDQFCILVHLSTFIISGMVVSDDAQQTKQQWQNQLFRNKIDKI